jgi:hypothetical protein
MSIVTICVYNTENAAFRLSTTFQNTQPSKAATTRRHSLTLPPPISATLIPPFRTLEPQRARLPSLPHHTLATPLRIPAFQHTRTPIHSHLLMIIIMLAIILALAAKQGHHILHSKILDRLPAFDSCVGELTLRFLQLEDTLFDGVVDGEAVHGYVDGLVETVDAVDCLFFDELVGC